MYEVYRDQQAWREAGTEVRRIIVYTGTVICVYCNVCCLGGESHL